MATDNVFGDGIQPTVLTGTMIGNAQNLRLELDPRLPAPAGERKRRLAEIKADAIAIGDALRSDFADAFAAVQKQASRVEQAQSLASRSFRGNADLAKDPKAMREARKDHAAADDHLASETEKLSRLERERARLEARIAKSRTVWQPVARVLDRVENYLRDQRGELRIAPEAVIGKADTVSTVSAKIAALRADLDEIERAPWPSDDAKARATHEIDQIAVHGEIKVTRLLDHRGSLDWPMMSTTVQAMADGRVDPYDRKEISADMALTVWLHRDAIVAKVHADIERLADDQRALTAESRAKRTAQLKGVLLDQQRVLAALIWRDGLHDQWPSDIDPRAALGFDGLDMDGLL